MFWHQHIQQPLLLRQEPMIQLTINIRLFSKAFISKMICVNLEKFMSFEMEMSVSSLSNLA